MASLTTLMPRSSGSSRGTGSGGPAARQACAAPSSRVGKEGWPRRVYREPARKRKGRGGAVSTYPPTSFWLSLLALPKARKGMGIWQSESILLYFPPSPPSHLPPTEARLDFFLPSLLNTQETRNSFPAAGVEEAWK